MIIFGAVSTAFCSNSRSLPVGSNVCPLTMPIDARTPRISGSIAATRLVIDELFELGPVGVIDRIHHIDALAAAIGKLHRLDIVIEDTIRIALAELHGDRAFGAFSSPHASLDM